MTLPAVSTRCPVCSEGFEAPPTKCPRCDAPHHADCWDYLPGCAVYACSDTAPRDQAVVSRIQELVLRKLLFIEIGAWTLFGSASYLIVGKLLLQDRYAFIISGLGLLLGGLLVFVSLRLENLSRFGGDDLSLANQRPQELKKIREAVLDREGGPLGFNAPTVCLALWSIGVLILLHTKLFTPFRVGSQVFEWPWSFFWRSVGALTFVCGAFVLPVLAAVNRLAAMASIEARRVQAAIDQDDRTKPVKQITIGE